MKFKTYFTLRPYPFIKRLSRWWNFPYVCGFTPLCHCVDLYTLRVPWSARCSIICNVICIHGGTTWHADIQTPIFERG